jgi:hypothetical protein
MDAGMKYLFESFYRSIQEGTPVPIPYREMLLTARIMDKIFHQLAESQNYSGFNELRSNDGCPELPLSRGA